MGFKNVFCKWIQIIYTNPKAFLKINGFLSETICIERGIRQGCPLSSLIFIICTEFMALFYGFDIVSNDLVKTIEIMQYADDTCLFLKNEPPSLH